MITISNKENCCGCHACFQKCPKHCIQMVRDEKGFSYPQVDLDSCVDCGLCEKVCPFLNISEKSSPQTVLAAINNNESIRLQSSSGGIFTLLAEKVIQGGGIVFGARFDDHWQVTMDHTDNVDGLADFRGSKYVQCYNEDSFLKAESFLKEGRTVLFSGSPCQIAAFNRFLAKPYDNLITVDYVCHGVPSPGVWERYLKEMIEKRKDVSSLSIQAIRFRDKTEGWNNYKFVIDFAQQDKTTNYSETLYNTTYGRAFLTNLILRPSCFHCKTKEGRSGADITIADFWGVATYHPDFDDNKGTGLVLVNSDKGASFIGDLDMKCVVSSIEEAIPNNPGLKAEAIANSNSRIFWYYFKKYKRFDKAFEKTTDPGIYMRIIRKFSKKLL